MKENEMQWEEQRLVRREGEEEEKRSLSRKMGDGGSRSLCQQGGLCAHMRTAARQAAVWAG